MKRMRAAIAAAGLAASLCLPGSAACAAELKLYAAAGMKAPLERIASDFEAAGGSHVSLVFDTAGAAERRFIDDPGATFLVTTAERLRAAEAEGRLRAGASTAVGATVGGFAVAPGRSHPDISSAQQLKAALLAAPRIALSDPARGATVGRHFMQVIDALGIREQVLAKTTLAENGLETMHLVLAGKADLGVTQLSEIMQADPAALLGPFPAPFDIATSYALWLRADAPENAQAFARLVASPGARAKLSEFGLRPPQ
jgi:molybdate transport system substrate-binding protein